MLWKQLSPRYRRLLRSGQRGEAVVVDSTVDRSNSDSFGIYGWKVTIRVKLAGGGTADFDRYVEAANADDVTPGMILPVRFDPAKPSRVEIDAGALRAARARGQAQAHAAEDERVLQVERELRPLSPDPPDPTP
jgi:Protein of unknown function (DUF3592)